MTITADHAEDVFHRRHNTTPRLPITAPPFRAAPARQRREPVPAATSGVTALHREQERRLLLADLTSPWAYLAHLRFDQPGHENTEATERPVWWAIQPPTGRPLVGLRGPGPERERLRRELDAVRAVASEDEILPDDVPAVLPHPRPVAAAFAEAVDLGRGPQVRALLLRTFWLEGRDIGDPEVLRRILPSVLVDDGYPCTGDPRREWGYVVSPQRQPLSNAAYHLLERWQGRWAELGRPGPVTLVGPEGPRSHLEALPGATATHAA
ncbi:MAG TPA: hypothetical protein VK045_01950 [Ornithinicoccus sp.]|nr:hypothetical protein [Ornithinicoccus sp.]